MGGAIDALSSAGEGNDRVGTRSESATRSLRLLSVFILFASCLCVGSSDRQSIR